MVQLFLEYPMPESGLRSSQINQYRDEGYLCIRNSFDLEEIDLLRCTAKSDQELEDHAIGKSDDQGGVVPSLALEPSGE